MEIPALVRERLGDEEIRAGVSLGDEDAVCFTPTRTLVYRGDGLLSDESTTVLSHEVERIDVSEGRRKTKFILEYVDGEKSFSVPASRAEKVLELLMEGVLRVAGVAEDDESVLGVYRFSELALVLTDSRLVKHVGASLWDEDFEEFAFADVTSLDFEEGSVATQIVLSIDGRPQRIKAPNDEAATLRQTLAEALCEYHGADSLATLNDMLGPDEGDTEPDHADGSTDRSSGLTLDEGIDPLVGDDPDESTTSPMEDPRATGDSRSATPGESPEASESPAAETGSQTANAAGAGRSPADSRPGDESRTADSAPDRPRTDQDEVETVEPTEMAAGSDPGVSRADVDEIGEQLETLTQAVKRQNELLRKQQRTIKQLIQELRQGR